MVGSLSFLSEAFLGKSLVFGACVLPCESEELKSWLGLWAEGGEGRSGLAAELGLGGDGSHCAHGRCLQLFPLTGRPSQMRCSRPLWQVEGRRPTPSPPPAEQERGCGSGCPLHPLPSYEELLKCKSDVLVSCVLNAHDRPPTDR